MPHESPGEDGITFGGEEGGTYGGDADLAGTWGPQQDQRYRLRLRRGDRSAVIDAVLSISLELTHTAVSSIECEVPRLPGLSDFTLGTIDLEYGDQRLFRGLLTDYPGPSTAETATIGGPGPGHVLKRTDLSVSYSSGTYAEAIADVWREDTPFSATVVTPNSPTSISDVSLEGTALEVLQQLHEQAGMRFTIDPTADTRSVESYVPSEVPKTQNWTSVAHEASGDATGYGNKVIVYGGLDSNGQRVTATAKDQAEIDALAADDVFGDGVVEIRVDDDTLTTTADAQARADAELADRLGQDDPSGSVEIIPQVVLPGYHYDIPEFAQDGVTPTLPINTVRIEEAAGEAGVTLEVNEPDGAVALLARLDRGQAQLNQP